MKPTYFFTAFGLPEPATEYIFHHERKWRFDFCWVAEKVAVECEGAVWVQGRHTRGSGFVKDMEKYNEAGLLGYRVFRFQPKDLKNGLAANFMKRVLDAS